MWIGIPARVVVVVARVVRPRVAPFRGATAAFPRANAPARCASIVVVVVVVDWRRRRATSRGDDARGGHVVWANSPTSASRSVGRPRAARPRARVRPHATTRRRDVDVGGDQSARETRVVDRAATRDARIRDRAARDARATLGFHGRDAPVARRRGFATTRDARGDETRAGERERLERRSRDARVVDDARGARGAGRRAREAVVVRARHRRFANRARGLAIAPWIRRRFGADSRADMAMRRAESMPELGETRGSVSKRLRRRKRWDRRR